MSAMVVTDLSDADIACMRRRLSFLLRNPADVEDVVQDAYIRVLEYSKGGTAVANPAAFINRIARNLAIDKIRWQQRTSRICPAADDSEEIRAQVQNVASHERQADDVLEHDQHMQMLADVVSQLPRKCSEAYWMSSFGGQTYREISQSVGLSVSMIEKYVLRARRHVAAKVAPVYMVN